MNDDERMATLLREELHRALPVPAADEATLLRIRGRVRQRARRDRRRRGGLVAGVLVPIAAVAAVVLVLVVGRRSAPMLVRPAPAPTATARAVPTATPVVVTLPHTVRSVGVGTVTATLPHLTGGSARRDAAANATIAAAAGRLVAPEPDPPASFAATVTGTVLFQDPQVLAVRLAASTTTAGQAHPDDELTVLALSLTDGTTLDSADWFRDRDAALQVLAARTRADLVRADGAAQLFLDGITPTPAHYALLSPTPGGLRVDIPTYQVGPRPIGSPSVVVPWRVVDPLLTPAIAAAFGRPAQSGGATGAPSGPAGTASTASTAVTGIGP